MYTIGIDLGGTNIVASVVDDEYKIIGTSKTPTNAPRSAKPSEAIRFRRAG